MQGWIVASEVRWLWGVGCWGVLPRALSCCVNRAKDELCAELPSALSRNHSIASPHGKQQDLTLPYNNRNQGETVMSNSAQRRLMQK